MSHYALDACRVGSVGIFGEIEMPARDAYAGGKEFAFISTNFAGQRGTNRAVGISGGEKASL